MRTTPALPLVAAAFLFVGLGCNDSGLTRNPAGGTPGPTQSGDDDDDDSTPQSVDGQYSVSASPSQQACGQVGITTFTASSVGIATSGSTITADWGLDSAPGITVVAPPSGTLSGVLFTMSWSYQQSDFFSGEITTYENTWEGSFEEGGYLYSSLHQDITHETLGPVCSLSWNVSGQKI
jgi:hypothetical protein